MLAVIDLRGRLAAGEPVDYGAAVPVGDSVWIASEWTGQTCTFATYLADMTCGQTRTALANWSTRISLVRL